MDPLITGGGTNTVPGSIKIDFDWKDFFIFTAVRPYWFVDESALDGAAEGISLRLSSAPSGARGFCDVIRRLTPPAHFGSARRALRRIGTEPSKCIMAPLQLFIF